MDLYCFEKKDNILIFKNRIILKEGTWNDLFYPAEEIKKALADLKKDEGKPAEGGKFSIFTDHKEGIETWVGFYRQPFWDQGVKGIRAELCFVDSVLIKKLEDQKRLMGFMSFGVSPAMRLTEVNTKGKKRSAKDIEFRNISVVINPAQGQEVMLEEQRIEIWEVIS